MNLAAVLFTIAILAGVYGLVWIGTLIGKEELDKVKRDLVTANSVKHNLNCLVGDLKHETGRIDGLLHEQNVKVLELRNSLKVERGEVKKFKLAADMNKADAAAWHQSKGLWCTDKVHLIKYHARKEMFFRLGYPEHKL